jgi:hypothetical protein
METDNTELGRLRTHLLTAPGQEQYLAWIKNPMTQMMLTAGREMVRPAAPFPPFDGIAVSFALGETVGGNRILDFFATPISSGRDRATAVAGLQPTYGAERILMEGKQ